MGWLWAPLAAGLAGSLHCAGMCGAFAGLASARGRWHAAAWNLGRAAAYAILGGLAAALGQRIPGPAWMARAVAGAALLVLGLHLAGVPVVAHLPLPRRAVAWSGRFARAASLPGRFAFGMSAALLPCGLLWAALAMAVGAGAPARGALTLLAFWAGTLPALGLAGTLSRLLLRSGRWGRRLVAVVVVAAAGWALVARQAVPEGDPACHGDHPVQGS